MPEFSVKGTTWVSLSLNAILGCLVLYYSLLASRSTRHPGLDIGTTLPSDVFQNATENFLQYPIDFENATAVFNSVYGVAKEKDANMNPVGVNFFPAYVPPNTMMYHSRGDPNIPESFEWIAMDYEFSYSFAGFNRENAPARRPGGPGGFPKRKSRKDPPSDSNLEKRSPFGNGPTYLMSFRNKHPLNKLVFLDGASAAKTSTGEMDQQLILSQQDPDEPVDERRAADRICKWGESFGLQGVVRLEVGFEIIVCDFHRDLELVSNVTLYNGTKLAGLPKEPSEPGNPISLLIDRWQARNGFEWMQAGGNVNDGDDRFFIDYSHMVTPLNKTWIDPDPYQRRINNIPQALKTDILNELESTLSRGVDPFRQTDWRQICGHIIDKFSPMLMDFNNTLTVFAHSVTTKSLKAASESLSEATYNFVRRYSDEALPESRPQAVLWAIEDYVHNTYAIQTDSDRLIYSSVYKVTKEIISMVFDLYDESMAIITDSPGHENSLLEQREKLSNLLKALKWSVFTQCSRKCEYNEVCGVPGWGPGPLGWWFGLPRAVHYEDGSYRIDRELQCVSVESLHRGNK